MRSSLVAAVLLLLGGCSCEVSRELPRQPAGERRGLEWALVIHGGAGTISREMPEEEIDGYRHGLERALRVGVSILDGGGTSLDAVEQVIRTMEDDPRFNAGKGAVFNHDGSHELDASIMDGATLGCGAVAGVVTIKNPISLARRVMERTPHVLLAGTGAERFADLQEVARVDGDYYFSEARYRQYREALEAETERPTGGGTVGAVALDREGNLAAGTSTGGLTNKMFGRVGDSPIAGAGTYAKNGVAGVSGTGRGEEFIRHSVARSVVWLVEEGGLTVRQAADRMVHEVLRPGDGGVIVLGADGTIAMAFNTPGMYRGMADANGAFEVRIWE